MGFLFIVVVGQEGGVRNIDGLGVQAGKYKSVGNRSSLLQKRQSETVRKRRVSLRMW